MFWKNENPKWYKQWSIVNKLTFLYTSVTSSILIFLAIIAYIIVHQIIITAEKQYIIDEAHVLQNLLQRYPHQLSALTQEVNAVPTALTDAEYHYYIRIYDAKNKTLMTTPCMNKAIPDPQYPPVNDANWQNKTLHWTSSNGRKFLSMAAPIQFDKNGNSNLYMQMALDGTYPENIINNYAGYAAIFLLMSICLIFLLGRTIAKEGLSRLYDMIHIAQNIRIDKLTGRFENQKWPQELIPLGIAFNNMLDRIEKAFHRLSECTTELAHELRTPIHNLMLATEVVLGRPRSIKEYNLVLESNFEEYQRISNIIDSVLFLARTESPKYHLNRQKINLVEELNKIMEYYKIAAAEKNIIINLTGQGTIRADQTLFQRAIGNLLGNAIQHTPEEGFINIDIDSNSHNMTEISIKNNGLAIPSDQLPYVFDRFYRIKATSFQSSSGIGLGLAIVKSIMDLHGGKVSVQSESNEGTKFNLIFTNKLM